MNHPAMADARIASLHCYPLKSAAGLTLPQATLTTTGIEHDRGWMVVDAAGVFITQRETPRLAQVHVALEPSALALHIDGLGSLRLALDDRSRSCRVRVWQDDCAAYDAGDAAAHWITSALQRPCRLVRFDPAQLRNSATEWTDGATAPNQFSDGFPLLVIGRDSLRDLNTRLSRDLPMNRFRPNIVIDGLPAYAEDRIHELEVAGVTLRLVKPCTRCSITTTDQQLGVRDGDEPLRTLRSYRYDAALRGVRFGQNAIIVRGVGNTLRNGAAVTVHWKN